MKFPTQAETTRLVKGAVAGFHAATGRIATGTKITFREGEPIVEITSSVESPPPAPVETGGVNVEELKKRVGRLHRAARGA